MSSAARPPTATFYLKACSPVFPTEAAITRILAASNPDLLPIVVATDDAENWLLMGDLGKTFLGDGAVAGWPAGLRAQAAIQRRWLGRTDELARAGFERRGLAALASQISALPELPLLAPMKPESRRRLEAAIPRLIEACERLSAIGPAETIVHGDLHPWNIADVDGRSIVFDWSDSCIGHPFLDLATYVGRTRDVAGAAGLRRCLPGVVVGPHEARRAGGSGSPGPPPERPSPGRELSADRRRGSRG